MHAAAFQIASYLNETLGVSLSLAPWADGVNVPPFLRHRYQFFVAEMLSRPVLFMFDEAIDEETPAIIQKHIAVVQAKWAHSVVYARQRVTAYNRKRLIQHRVPFVVPGNQMYMPELAIDLREYFKTQQSRRETFSPSTQAVFIDALLRASDEPLVAVELAPELGYSTMTLSRAFDEIENAGLATSNSAGRARHLQFAASWRDVWHEAQPFLAGPARRRHYIEPASHETLGPRAGLSALAQYTMIAGPEIPVFAVSRKHWKSLLQQGSVQELPLREPDAFEVEVWSYRPTKRRNDDGVVDQLSLYLSLRGTSDERVESALEEMMSGMPW